MNKQIFFTLFLGLILINTQAQNQNKPKLPVAPKPDLRVLKRIEDSLKTISHNIVQDSIPDHRQKACYAFIPMFVRALKNDNSFYYPFDSLAEIARIYPADSSFRIFTWQVQGAKGKFRYYGVLQRRSTKMKITPLFDAHDTLEFQSQRVLTGNTWYGCLYYNIVEHTINRKPYYTLFGYEAADQITRRKILDVLTFDDKNQALFGAPIFYFKYSDSSQPKMTDTLKRFFLEYKWNAYPTLNYDKELDMIVFDHVAPMNERAKGAYFTYVPDGTYEGFKYVNNHWAWVEKVFTFSINESDNPPIPFPLFGQPKHQPKLPDHLEK